MKYFILVVFAVILGLAHTAYAQYDPDEHNVPAVSAKLIEIKFTYVDMSASNLKMLGLLHAEDTATAPQLPSLQAMAALHHVPLQIIPGPNITTGDGIVGIVSAHKDIPYGKQIEDPYYFTIENTVSAAPRVNPDGTITVFIRVFQSRTTRLRPNIGSRPGSVTQKVQLTRRFADGESILIAAPLPDSSPARLLYATVSTLPPPGH